MLADYPGTLLLISHDLAFVEGVGIEREYRLGEEVKLLGDELVLGGQYEEGRSNKH